MDNRSSGFDFNKPTIIALLYLVGLLTGFLGLVGLVLAYVWKGEVEGTWMRSHMSFHIRTFWFAVLAGLAASVLWFIGLKWFGLILVGVYVAARSFLALMRAQKQMPISKPQTLFWE